MIRISVKKNVFICLVIAIIFILSLYQYCENKPEKCFYLNVGDSPKAAISSNYVQRNFSSTLSGHVHWLATYTTTVIPTTVDTLQNLLMKDGRQQRIGAGNSPDAALQRIERVDMEEVKDEEEEREEAKILGINTDSDNKSLGYREEDFLRHDTEIENSAQELRRNQRRNWLELRHSQQNLGRYERVDKTILDPGSMTEKELEEFYDKKLNSSSLFLIAIANRNKTVYGEYNLWNSSIEGPANTSINGRPVVQTSNRGTKPRLLLYTNGGNMGESASNRLDKWQGTATETPADTGVGKTNESNYGVTVEYTGYTTGNISNLGRNSSSADSFEGQNGTQETVTLVATEQGKTKMDVIEKEGIHINKTVESSRIMKQEAKMIQKTAENDKRDRIGNNTNLGSSMNHKQAYLGKGTSYDNEADNEEELESGESGEEEGDNVHQKEDITKGSKEDGYRYDGDSKNSWKDYQNGTISNRAENLTNGGGNIINGQTNFEEVVMNGKQGEEADDELEDDTGNVVNKDDDDDDDIGEEGKDKEVKSKIQLNETMKEMNNTVNNELEKTDKFEENKNEGMERVEDKSRYTEVQEGMYKTRNMSRELTTEDARKSVDWQNGEEHADVKKGIRKAAKQGKEKKISKTKEDMIKTNTYGNGREGKRNASRTSHAGTSWLMYHKDVSCAPLDPKLLLYNRIFKTGSTSINKYMIAEWERNYFQIRVGTTEDWYKTGDSFPYPHVIEKFANRSMRRRVYTGHFFFRKDLKIKKQYTYINQLREPLERVLSHYFYMRNSSQRPKKRITEMIAKGEYNETLRTCFEKQHRGCESNVMTHFLCGTEDFCRSGSEKAVQRAKFNMLHNYASIGLTEHLDLYLKILKKRLPKYFRLSRQLNREKANQNGKLLAMVDDGLKAEIKRANFADYQVYEYAKNLFKRQLKACKIRMKQRL